MSTQKKLTGAQLYDKESKLAQYDGPDRIVSSHELQEELKKTEESVFLVPTFISSLDRLQGGGFEAGELVVVTGPTGEGKTTLLMSITKHMSAQGTPSAWFTLEVTPRQFLQKITVGDQVPLFYLPNENTDNTIKWLEERIIEAKVKYGVRVVFIDHLHQIFSMAKVNANSNISFEIGDLTAKIKNIALNHNLVIFLIAHTKDDPQGSAREPRKEDIRDSGLISRLADSIIGVWRVPNDEELKGTRRKAINEDDTKAKVRIFKNRRTGKLGAWFMFHKDHSLEERIGNTEWLT